MNVRQSACLFVCLSVYLSVCLSVYVSVCLSMCLSIFVSVYVSVYLCVCLSIYLCVYLYFCPRYNFFSPPYSTSYSTLIFHHLVAFYEAWHLFSLSKVDWSQLLPQFPKFVGMVSQSIIFLHPTIHRMKISSHGTIMILT